MPDQQQNFSKRIYLLRNRAVFFVIPIIIYLAFVTAYIIAGIQFNSDAIHPPTIDSIKVAVTAMIIFLGIGAILLVILSIIIYIKKSTLTDLNLIFFAGITVIVFMFFFIIAIIVIDVRFANALTNYQEAFYDEYKELRSRNNATVPAWLNSLQSKFNCCGYKDISEYGSIPKPPSCCDVTKNNEQSQRVCRGEGTDADKNTPNINWLYYAQGCSEPLSVAVNNYYLVLFLILLIGVITMIIAWLLIAVISIRLRKYSPISRGESTRMSSTGNKEKPGTSEST